MIASTRNATVKIAAAALCSAGGVSVRQGGSHQPAAAVSSSAGDHVNPAITTLVVGQTFTNLEVTEANNNTEYRNCTINGTLSVVPASAGASSGPDNVKFNGCTAQMLFQRASSNILYVDTHFDGPIVDTQSQIKGYNGHPPTNIEFLRSSFANVTRGPLNAHVEGLYVLAMVNGWFTDMSFTACEVMDLNFQSDVADNNGVFGPINGVVVRGGTYALPTPTGTNSIYISQDGTVAPTNVVINTAGMTVGGSIFIEVGAAANGCVVI